MAYTPNNGYKGDTLLIGITFLFMIVGVVYFAYHIYTGIFE